MHREADPEVPGTNPAVVTFKKVKKAKLSPMRYARAMNDACGM